MKKINLDVIVGIFLLIFGVILGLNKLKIGLFIDYRILLWSFLSILGIFITINDKKLSILSSLFIFIGAWNILSELKLITTSIFSLFWPIIIIIIGLNFIFGKKLICPIPKDVAKNKNELVYNGILSSVEERLQIKDFKGLSATAVFGGVELDLRDVEITENIQLDLTAIFGGVALILPTKYNVVVVSPLSLFGGTENKFKSNLEDNDKKTIYINSRAIFGGVELK